MERTVSATEARIRFGEMMRRGVEEHKAIIVERGGKPYVVMLSVNEYNRLKAAQPRWQDVLNEIRTVRARVQAQLLALWAHRLLTSSPSRLPLYAGRVHFIRQVEAEGTIQCEDPSTNG